MIMHAPVSLSFVVNISVVLLLCYELVHGCDRLLILLICASGMWYSVEGFQESTAHGGSVKIKSVGTPTIATKGMKY
jgi:hypothetical protein